MDQVEAIKVCLRIRPETEEEKEHPREVWGDVVDRVVTFGRENPK